MLTPADYDNTVAPLRRALARFSARRLDAASLKLRAAAVAIVVVATPEPAVLVTLRTPSLRQHAGQFALPGGGVDAGESVDQAAAREVREELGLVLHTHHQLGRLDDYQTRSGYCISSLVYGCPDPSGLAPNASEVARVFSVPFSELVSYAIPLFEPGASEDKPVLYSDLPSIGTPMYAPTAALLYQFREVALLGRATRIDGFDQPRFAWR
ncbi:MAG: CoA pyrophosphatase [Pseudomonadota bacterium]